MTRDKLLYKICPTDMTFDCRTGNKSCNCYDCNRVLEEWLDEYDKHVIEQYEAEHGNLADVIRDIHDCVAREMYCKGIDDIKCCLILNSRTESINGKVHLIITEDRISFIADQLKEQSNEEI